MTVDYIIVGQGLCGTMLSWNLHKKGKKILVIDNANNNTATKVASGIVNPVTGRRVVTTWMAEELLPFVWQAYNEFGKTLNEKLIEHKNTIVFAPSVQMKETYDKRMSEEGSFIQPVEDASAFAETFSFYFNCYTINPTYSINLHPMLYGWRSRLQDAGALLTEDFETDKLHTTSESVSYKNIRAEKIIFCDGPNAFTTHYWKNLPYVYNKGQAIIAEINDLPANNIYKFGSLTLAPWYNRLWWVGSTYENDFDTTAPTELFRVQTEESLKNILKIPFRILDHKAAVRPATIERRPFVGFHPQYKNIGILNGMGTKGCSLAPWFGKQLAEYLTEGTPLDPLADIKRFHRILSAE